MSYVVRICDWVHVYVIML